MNKFRFFRDKKGNVRLQELFYTYHKQQKGVITPPTIRIEDVPLVMEGRPETEAYDTPIGRIGGSFVFEQIKTIFSMHKGQSNEQSFRFVSVFEIERIIPKDNGVFLHTDKNVYFINLPINKLISLQIKMMNENNFVFVKKDGDIVESFF